MKFYTNLSKFDPIFFTQKTYYEFYHNWFYLCLLSKEIKLTLLNLFDSKKRNIFQSILNVTEEFCSSIEECDYVLLSPTHIQENFVEKNKFEIKHAIKNNKKIIFFIHLPEDSDTSFNIPHKIGIGFRATGLLSEATDNIFGLPMVNLDVFSKNYASKKLSISFCGYFDNQRYPIRMNVVNKFLKEIPEKCDFIINDSWGGDPLKFFKNIKNNLYGLCVRGGANCSFRLGEVLMMGRIPILIDTDCILPFPDLIPYDTNFIKIPIQEIDNMVNIIENYHESHTEEELIQIQKENRVIWETYYMPSNSFIQVKSIINNYT